MDSVTQVALIGVVGTAFAALVGAAGTMFVAAMGRRGQESLEDHKARRAAYANCATAILVRRDAITELMEGMRLGDLGLEQAQHKLQQAQAMRGDVMRTVGAVAIEGPAGPAAAADTAAHHLDVWLDGLSYWIGQGMPDTMLEPDQWRGRSEDKMLTEDAIDRFVSRCRRVLHPADDRMRRTLRQRLRRR
ncbi:hypothetical protein GTY75_09015 [Streptomyces sp. SID8381]|uniref:hypothetical protein n=1 Tax=unclassified Streptomyces TaxID=2593676 RepID=UPI00036D1CB9|nr:MULTISPECIES: hypothetical protein [unclassified Streptomyces]MYX26807.1 hypothetical protein [Streptomyces sp. SID8381]